MSRSNPTESSQNPSTRWYGWNGSQGNLEWYNKETKEQINAGDKFSFLLLDSLSCVKGWHDPSESGIYSNEVRDTRSDRLVVKSFKGGTLVEGLYADIKDRANAVGGKFNINLYIAYKSENGQLKIGALTLAGAALSAWMEFSKANRKALNEGAVQINGSDEGKKGSIKFKTPRFSLITASEQANTAAIELDKELQEYLRAYLKKNKAEPQEQEYEPEDEGTEAQRNQQAEWQAAEEQDRRQKAGGDTKLRELANRPSNSGSVPGVVNEGWDDSDPENQLPF